MNKPMVKQIVPAIAVVFLLSSCSAIKTLNFSGSKQAFSATAAVTETQPAKFINDISVTPETTHEKTVVRTEPAVKESNRTQVAKILQKPISGPNVGEGALREEPAKSIELVKATTKAEKSVIESASNVQLKYAILLKTEVEYLPSKSLLDVVDEWYGVRYRSGGNTKSGVDCSGFTLAVFAAAYGLSIPRVSREQYRVSRKVSTTELQEGDLVFFNTQGRGVSHVGVYLGNNKFIHASVSRGVMVNDLFEPYYMQRFLGAGRIDDKQLVSAE
ncbi:MAG: C40 family peptidase [Bacteroidetes bacterium]|nr:C40 family peptidase [Bacteroidota bacterium]